jgi:hypothetical protein
MKIVKKSKDMFFIDNPEFTIITFDVIIESVVLHFLNLIYNICDNQDKIQLNSDYKKLFIHSLIDKIYLRISEENNNNIIIYINTSFTTNFCEIWNYFDRPQLNDFLHRTCKNLSLNLPVPIYVDNHNRDLAEDVGDTKELVMELYNRLQKFKNKPISLDRIKKYSRKNGLLEIMRKYHSTEEYKNNILYTKYFKGANNE